MKVVCGCRRGPRSPKVYKRATAGGQEAEGTLATAVCRTLPTPQNTTTALDGVVTGA